MYLTTKIFGAQPPPLIFCTWKEFLALLTLVLALPVKAANACRWRWPPPWLGSKFETCSLWDLDKLSPGPIFLWNGLGYFQIYASLSEVLLQEGGLLPGPKSGFFSNTWEWIVQGDTCTEKARDFIGKGHPGREQQGKGTQENCSATWLAVPDFMVMGLVSRLSLGNHSDSGALPMCMSPSTNDSRRKILGSS